MCTPDMNLSSISFLQFPLHVWEMVHAWFCAYTLLKHLSPGVRSSRCWSVPSDTITATNAAAICELGVEAVSMPQ